VTHCGGKRVTGRVEANRVVRVLRAACRTGLGGRQLSGDKQGAISLVCATQYRPQEEHS